VEHEGWMSEQIREEIADLRGRFGFEQDEAVACWHLRQAAKLMRSMWQAGIREEMEQEEHGGEAEAPGHLARLIQELSLWDTRVHQHFSALYRALGVRVLRRTFPEGWGRELLPEEEEEG
jgi:hypothetical protein